MVAFAENWSDRPIVDKTGRLGTRSTKDCATGQGTDG
jgi:hypothetical protein